MNINTNNKMSFGKNFFRRKKNKSEIEPDFLSSADAIQKIKDVEKKSEPIAKIKFDDLSLDATVKQNIQSKGYEYLTPIQVKSYDQILNKKNVVGIANTGTGKTGAFLIPLVNNILTKKINDKIMIVVPTRELALQVADELNSITEGLPISAATFIGGTSVNKDIDKLKRKNHFIIGTPGRLIDLMNQKALNLSTFEVLVIDEFDRMLDMGFINDVNKILSAMKGRKQTILFSATIDKNQEKLVSSIAIDAERISVDSGVSSTQTVDQNTVELNGRDKFTVLTDMLKDVEFKKVLVFAETKRSVDGLNKKLKKSGFNSDTIHGNKSQNYRVKALNNFKTGLTKILIATDVAARGIDITDITHVINYQKPKTMDSYIHRIGRTGRAGKLGVAFTFID